MAKKTKEPTSKGVIKSLLSKAWEKVKDLPRRLRGTKADVEAKERKRIAEKTGRSASQVRDIEKGKRPGRNLLDALKKIKRGRKVEPPPKEPEKITRRKEKPEKPPTEPPKKPPPELPPPPSRVVVDFKGMVGPWPDDDYLRRRRVHVSLEGDQAARFAALWREDKEADALKLATSAYFKGIGPGYLETTVDDYDINQIDFVE